MFALAWYGWVGIVLAVLFLVVYLALRGFRAGLRREFAAFLAEYEPDVKITAVRRNGLDFRLGEVSGTAYLNKVYAAVAQLGGKSDTPENRRRIFQDFADELIGGTREAGQPLTRERHGDRILVRLVPAPWPAGLPTGHAVPHRPVRGLDLRTVYVLDSENSVRYLTESDLADLGLDQEGVHELALENLRARFSPDVVAGVLRERSMVAVKALDSYDAARVLLVPEYLKEGEEVAALIPDRDTLTLVAVPAEGDWGTLRELARVPASEHLLLDRPLRVTRAGFEVI
jgi:hypothetical protein